MGKQHHCMPTAHRRRRKPLRCRARCSYQMRAHRMDAGRRGQSCRTHCRGTASWHHADGASAKQLERHMQQPLAAEKQGGDLYWAHRAPARGASASTVSTNNRTSLTRSCRHASSRQRTEVTSRNCARQDQCLRIDQLTETPKRLGRYDHAVILMVWPAAIRTPRGAVLITRSILTTRSPHAEPRQ